MSLPCYGCSCWPSFCVFSTTKSGVAYPPMGKPHHYVAVEAVDPFGGLPHQYQTQIRYFITFICCECAHVWVLTKLPLALVHQAFGRYQQISRYLLMGKPQCSDVVEVVDPFKWAPKSLWNMLEAFHNIYMLWMCSCKCLHHVTAAVVGQACDS